MGYFVVILGLFFAYVEAILGPILGLFWGYFEGLLEVFWKAKALEILASSGA